MLLSVLARKVVSDSCHGHVHSCSHLWATAAAMATAMAIVIVMAMATAMAIVVAMAQAITANDRTKMQQGDRYTHMQCCCVCPGRICAHMWS